MTGDKWAICYLSLLVWGFSATQVQSIRSSVYVDGDFIIGALFSVHFQPSYNDRNALNCGPIHELYGIQRVEAALWTLKQINKRTDMLTGVTLGLEVRDSCWYAPVALQQSLELVRNTVMPNEIKPLSIDEQQVLPNLCHMETPIYTDKIAPLIGVVGPASSSVTLQVQNLVQLFSIPQIGYSSTSRDLSDKSRYSTFLRVVPSDNNQAQLLVDLLRYFNWTYVSTVNTDENYGISGIQVFRELAEKNGVCVDKENSIMTTADDNSYDAVVNNLKSGTAKVVICFCEGLTVRYLINATKRLNVTDRFVFMGSDGWADRNDVVHNLEKEAWGSLSIRIHSPYITEFDNYYLSRNPYNDMSVRYPWFNEFWQSRFNCTLPPELTKNINMTMMRNYPNCTREERLLREKYMQDPKLGFVMKSMWTLAHGLHNMLEEICGRNYKNACPKMLPFNNTHFKNHLMKVKFKFREEPVMFDERGDPPARYEILNYQRMANNTYAYVQIGEWVNGTLTITGSPQSRGPELVESVCSKPCPSGQYRNFKSGGQEKRCCWACTRCDDNQITDKEQSKCITCLRGQLPNKNKTACDFIPVEYTMWSDVEAIIAMVSAGMGFLATYVTYYIFIKNKNTPVVKASTRELCYLILAGIACSHISILTVLTKPTYISCTLSRLMPGISFAMIYASLFTKTNRIYRILAVSKKRFPKQKLRFMSATAQIAISCLLIAIEVVVAATMLVLEPAMPMIEYPPNKRAILTCATTPRAVLSPLAFDGVLIGLCTLYAIKTHNVPANFNEAKFIGFAMYTTCVIWIAFMPIYFGSDYKVITMCMCVSLSATVILIFIFLPKIYVIIFRPERNNRSLFVTSKTIRCHIGAKVAPEIDKPSSGVYKMNPTLYRIPMPEDTDSSSAYNRSNGKLRRRNVFIQTDKELLVSYCQSLLMGTSTLTPSSTITSKASTLLLEDVGKNDVDNEGKNEIGSQQLRSFQRHVKSTQLDGEKNDWGQFKREEQQQIRSSFTSFTEWSRYVKPESRCQRAISCTYKTHHWAELDAKRLVDDLKRQSVLDDHTHCQRGPTALVKHRPMTNEIRDTRDMIVREEEPKSRIREEREQLPADSGDPLIRITITLDSKMPCA